MIAAVGALALALVQAPELGLGLGRDNRQLRDRGVIAAGLFLRSFARATAAPVVDLRLFARPHVRPGRTRAMFFANLAFGLQLLGLILWMQGQPDELRPAQPSRHADASPLWTSEISPRMAGATAATH